MNWIQKIVTKIGVDKVAHFFGCAFLALALGRFVHPAIAAGVTLSIGLGKELFDGIVDWKDFLADALGVVASILLLIL